MADTTPQTNPAAPALKSFLAKPNKVLFGSYVHHAPSLENHFHYQNSGLFLEEVFVALYDAGGEPLLDVPAMTYALPPHEALAIDASAMLRRAGRAHFRGSIVVVVASDSAQDDMGQRDFVSYWSSSRGNACHVGFGGFPALNVPGKKEGKTYNMFCPAVLSSDREKTLIVAFNHSTDISYNDTVSLRPTLHNLKGETMEGAVVSAPPMGLLQIDVDEVFGEKGRALLGETGGRGTVTVLHRGHQFATVFFHLDRSTNEIVSGTHTTPAASIPYSYGVTHPLINAWSEKSPFFYLVWKFKHAFRAQKLKWYRDLWGEFFHYAPRAAYRSLFPLHDRNPQMVQAQYDKRYQRALDLLRAKQLSFEEYIFGSSLSPEWTLSDDRIVWETSAQAYRSFLPHLEEYLAPHLAQKDATIIEFGCGSGRNLLYLRSKYPHAHFVGLELSPVGVELAREAAAAFDLPVQFMQADLTKPTNLGLQATAAYSCFSLEQMPRTFMQAVSAMSRASKGAVILFEPVPELYPWDVRGITSRCRAIVIDHVRHVLRTLKKRGYRIERAARLGMGNPLTEACVVVARAPEVRPAVR